MNTKSKIVLGAIFTIMLCVCVITGATLALFTSESKVNVAITSGEVKVVATLSDLAIYSAQASADGNLVDENGAKYESVLQSGTFANGGKAFLSDNALSLDQITPGDRAEFKITINNSSNVLVKYRTIITVVEDTGLVDGLQIQIGGNSNYDGGTAYTNWDELAVGSENITLNCSVELPITAGNDYQGKECKLAVVVEAIQGNASVSNAVARIGETEYDSLSDAISALNENDTLEITRPGNYAPFTIDVPNVTVKGIVGATKAQSTVIKNTATQNIKVFADNVTLESLYIDASKDMSYSSIVNMIYNGGVISNAIDPNLGRFASGLKVDKCHIVGNESMSVFYNSRDLSLTNSTLENFVRINQFESSGTSTQIYDSNKFINFESADGEIFTYMSYGSGSTLKIINNEFINSAGQISISDNNSTGTVFTQLEISGNIGKVTYALNSFNDLAKTPHNVVCGAEQEVFYATTITFENLTDEHIANYKIVKADGSELNAWFNDTLSASKWFGTGLYHIVERATGTFIQEFEVEIPVVGKTQVVSMPKIETVGTAEDLQKLLQEAFQNGATGNVYVKLSNDIDVNNQWTTFAIPNTSNDITIDGDGKTIKNLNKPLVTGLWGGSGTLTFQNLTIEDAIIDGYDSKVDAGGSLSASGAFMAYADHASKIVLDNCHLKNSTISSQAEYVGGLIGYSSADETVINNCTVVGSTISGYKSAGAIIGHVGATITISNVSSTGNKLIGNTTGREWGVGAIFGRSNEKTVVTMSTIAISGNTFSQEGAKDSQTSEYYGKNYGTTTLDGTAI